jgi:hypothetical protein
LLLLAEKQMSGLVTFPTEPSNGESKKPADNTPIFIAIGEKSRIKKAGVAQFRLPKGMLEDGPRGPLGTPSLIFITAEAAAPISCEQ